MSDQPQRYSTRRWLLFWRAVIETATGQVMAVCRPGTAEPVRAALEIVFGRGTP